MCACDSVMVCTNAAGKQACGTPCHQHALRIGTKLATISCFSVTLYSPSTHIVAVQQHLQTWDPPASALKCERCDAVYR